MKSSHTKSPSVSGFELNVPSPGFIRNLPSSGADYTKLRMDFKPSDPLEPVRWATMIPLIGGSAIGCSKATGNLPLFHLSYSAFSANESHLQKHWPEVPMIRLDKGRPDLARFLAGGEIDFVNSVCPCAGLSMLNTSVKGPAGRGSDAKQNEWMMKSAEFVLENVRPKVLWGENAPGLFLSLGEAMVPRLRLLGLQYGYSFSMVKTNTQLHGLPQQRMRTFYFFWRSATVPFLEYTNKAAPHLHDFLKTVPSWATFQDQQIAEGKVSERFLPYTYILLRENLTHSEFVKKFTANNAAFTVSKYLEKNDLIDDCIAWLEENHPESRWSTTSKKSRTFVQYLKHMKSKLNRGLGYWDDSPKFLGDHFTAVITKNVAFAAHPEEDRFFNIRELLHLMGMPDDFQVENPGKNWNHICQNVPVTTAADWAGQVVKFCRGQLEISPFSFIKQDNISQKIVQKEYDTLKVDIKDEVVFDPMLDEIINEFEGDIKQEMKFDVEQQLHKKEALVGDKKSFDSNYSDFLTQYQPIDILPSPLKKIKLEEELEEELEESVFELNEEEVEDYLAGIKLPSPKKEDVEKVYKCGVCLEELVLKEKEQARLHVESCKEPVTEMGGRKQCGCCGVETDSLVGMVEHWVTTCRKIFNREYSPQREL